MQEEIMFMLVTRHKIAIFLGDEFEEFHHVSVICGNCIRNNIGCILKKISAREPEAQKRRVSFP
jgi:hypothetical protein